MYGVLASMASTCVKLSCALSPLTSRPDSALTTTLLPKAAFICVSVSANGKQMVFQAFPLDTLSLLTSVRLKVTSTWVA